MKKIIAIITLFLLTCYAVNAQEHLKFKGIPIDGDSKAFVQKLKEAGYVQDSSGDVVYYKGTFAGLKDCSIMVKTTPKSNIVCSIMVLTDDVTSWYDLKGLYNKLKDSYSAKYELDASYDFFSSPYYEGDGYEIQAVKLDKCHYMSFFNASGGKIVVKISAVSSSKGYVVIIYEDTINTNLSDKEKEQTVFDDI